MMDYEEEFKSWFMTMLLKRTESCFERDVLRDCKEQLKASYIKRAKEFDEAVKNETPGP